MPPEPFLRLPGKSCKELWRKLWAATTMEEMQPVMKHEGTEREKYPGFPSPHL